MAIGSKYGMSLERRYSGRELNFPKSCNIWPPFDSHVNLSLPFFICPQPSHWSPEDELRIFILPYHSLFVGHPTAGRSNILRSGQFVYVWLSFRCFPCVLPLGPSVSNNESSPPCLEASAKASTDVRCCSVATAAAVLTMAAGCGCIA